MDALEEGEVVVVTPVVSAEVAAGSKVAAAAAAWALKCFCAVACVTSSFSLADDKSPIFCACATVNVRGVPVGTPGTVIDPAGRA